MALTDNLCGFWEFNEASGSTTADATGNGYTTTNGGTVTVNTGKIGNAREFKGSGYQTVSGHVLDNITTAFSAAGWVKFYTINGTYTDGSGSSTYRNALRCDDGVVANSGFIMRTHAGGFEAYIGNGAAYNGHEIVGAFSANTWYHIAITYNSSTNTFIQYINGVAQYTNSSASWGNMTHPGVTSTQPFFGRAYNSTEYMDGLLDSWGVWSRVLSASEISVLYNYGNGIPYPFSRALNNSNIVSYWKLDETSGSRVDSYGSNNLTANGTTSYTTGKLNNAVSLNGTTGNYLSAASNSGLQTGNTNFCVSAWINSNSIGTKLAFAKAGGGGGNEWSIATDISDSKIWFVFWNAQTVITKSPSTVSSGTWYHVVAWINNSANTANLCINNGAVQSNSLISYPSTGSDPFVIGAYSDGSFAWNGYVDEVGFWKGVPNAADIAFLYGSGTPPTFPWDSTAPLFVTRNILSQARNRSYTY